ncbi:protein kinase domain-containing protein [Achromobacter xylosoxidans]
MPALDGELVQDLERRLKSYLESSGGFEELEFLDAGGSAAVYMVRRADSRRAVKVFDPALFSGTSAAASKRRLGVQRRLIGHSCQNLIQTYFAAEAQGTAFIEMEFVEWPQLTKCLTAVPDNAVATLIGQLVDAVRYLESLNIVHRDIKPENIHVSPDFRQLILLDLGVAREFDQQEENDGAVTDTGARRPFLATAQYSSPEYLFRLDEPTEKLWKGLNFYQVGAVLHDLIKKEPLFQHEVSLGNRWLVARAVLAKSPAFSDVDPNRLSVEKSVALRCLSKDIDTRLALVGWEDFQFEKSDSHLSSLKSRLSKGIQNLGRISLETSAERLNFERSTFLKRVFERVRTELLEACGNQLPLTMTADWVNPRSDIVFQLTPNKSIGLVIVCRAEWKADLYERHANLMLGAQFIAPDIMELAYDVDFCPAFEAAIGGSEDETVSAVSNELARLIELALSRIETAEGGVEVLHSEKLSSRTTRDKL